MTARQRLSYGRIWMEITQYAKTDSFIRDRLQQGLGVLNIIDMIIAKCLG